MKRQSGRAARLLLPIVLSLVPCMGWAQSELGKGTRCAPDLLPGEFTSVAGYPNEVKQFENVRVRFYQVIHPDGSEATDIWQGDNTKIDIKMPSFEEFGLSLQYNTKIYRRICGQKVSIRWFEGRDNLIIVQVEKEIDF
jgi:hypothetical protein